MWYQDVGEKLLGGHAMCVVGYNAEGFIVRNSWGDDWLDNGYCMFPYSDWGMQWEVWSTVDAKSNPNPPTPVKRSCWKRFWDWVLHR
jgi:C1A family cysteine protease